MARKPNEFKEILRLFEALHQEYPNYSIGRHLSTAFSDYGDLWGVSNKEFLFGLTKYKSQLELGFIPESEESLNKIIEDAQNNLFNIDETEDDY